MKTNKLVPLLQRLSLRSRLLGSVIFLVILLVVSLTFLFLRSEKLMMDGVSSTLEVITPRVHNKLVKNIDEVVEIELTRTEVALKTKAQGMAKLIARLAPVSLLTYDSNTLIEYCAEVSRDKDIIICYVTDTKGDINAAYLNRKNKVVQNEANLLEQTNMLEIAKILKDLGNNFDVRVDIVQDEELLGQVVLLVSNESLKIQESDILANYNILGTSIKESFDFLQKNIIESANKTFKSSKFLLLGIAVLGILVSIVVAFFIAKSITTIIKEAVDVVKNIAAKGDLSKTITAYSNDEIGDLAGSITGMVWYLNEMAMIAGKIAEGDFSVKIEPKSESDVMGNAMKAMVESLEKMANVAEDVAKGDVSMKFEPKSASDLMGRSLKKILVSMRKMTDIAGNIAKGDLSTDIRPRSEKDILGHALLEMTQNLREVTAENKKQDWLKSGQTGLNDIIHGEQGINELSQNIISFLASYLNAQIGAIYLTNEDDDFLRLTGGYAFTERKNLSNKLKLGEGLVGQAALEKHSISITNLPDDYIKIQSGLGDAVPRNALVVPFLYEESLQGVIEIGSLEKLTDIQLEFLNLVTGSIAISFLTAKSQEQTRQLLTKTQEQAEKLQAQQEELRVTNEELSEQATVLKESEEKLQAQQEELRVTNEELEEHTKILKESETKLQVQQEELQEANSGLEERTEELENQKNKLEDKNQELKKAQQVIVEKAEELELTSKYKSEFLANMSHELRTPLNSLLILSKLLYDNKDGNLTEKQVEFARTVHASGSDLLSLINDILDLSKVESGKMQLNIEDIYLNDLTANIRQTFLPMVQQKQLSLNINLAEGLPDKIETDVQRVNQIIKNLLSNSVKFTSEGGITVNIQRPDADKLLPFRGLDPKKTITISVSDTGIGIPKEKQKLIFEAFQQADGSTSRKYGGTGLGLSISRELAKFLGGGMQLESEEGKGSTFTIFLPDEFSKGTDTGPEEASKTLSDSAGQPTKTAQAKNRGKVEKPVEAEKVVEEEKPAETAKTEQQNIRKGPPPGLEAIRDDRRDIEENDKIILIIEDDPNFAKILFGLVHEKGYKCIVAGDGETGLQFADYYKPMAIMLDVSLPGIDGWTVMERLKGNADTRNIPVHFVTGNEDKLEALKMGAIGFLTKPVSIEMLDGAFNKIEDVLSSDIKRLLFVGEEKEQSDEILELINSDDIKTTIATSCQKTYESLKSEKYDCMILDPLLDDKSGFDLLEKIKKDKTICSIPIIIYASQELSKEEEAKLRDYAEHIVLKKVISPEKLLDECVLFLHLVEKTLTEEQPKACKMTHDKEAVFEKKKILIVDDDIRNVFALTSVLEDRGMEILVAQNGKEGLECLDQNPDTDLVLMDIMMPEMNGYEATREIRKQDRFNGLPIITLTAKAMKGDRNKCIEAGATDYLAKPVDVDRLLSVLRVWLYKDN